MYNIDNKGEMKYFKSILYDECDMQYTKYQHERIQGHKKNLYRCKLKFLKKYIYIIYEKNTSITIAPTIKFKTVHQKGKKEKKNFVLTCIWCVLLCWLPTCSTFRSSMSNVQVHCIAHNVHTDF